jgi:hypothetical protein
VHCETSRFKLKLSSQSGKAEKTPKTPKSQRKKEERKKDAEQDTCKPFLNGFSGRVPTVAKPEPNLHRLGVENRTQNITRCPLLAFPTCEVNQT